MFILNNLIKIGKYTFKRVKDVEIERGIHQLGATAKITLPTQAVNKGKVIDLAKELKQGDEVEITLEYEKVYTGIEFKGFVKRIKEGMPIVVECEDMIYKLRSKNFQKSWKATTLKDVLNHIIAGTGIKIKGTPPDVNLKTFYLKNVNGAEALKKIKEQYGLSVYFETDSQLYVGLAYTNKTGTVKYDLLKNIVKSDLKYREAKDIKLKVKAIHIKKDNSKIEETAGDTDGEQRTLYFYELDDPKKLKERAEEEIKKYKYSGYEGSLTSFLVPQAVPAMTAQITDTQFGRKGSYFVEKVKTRFGTSGARREVHLGIKLSTKDEENK